MFCKFKTKSKGFTLVELFVVIAIIGILTTVLLLGGTNREMQVLQREANELAQNMREMQEMAMGAKEVVCPAVAGVPITRIFGVNWKTIGGAGTEWQGYYTLFGECNSPPTYEFNPTDIEISKVYYEKEVKVCNILPVPPPVKLNLAFAPPDPTVFLNGATSTQEAIITLCLKSDPSISIDVKVNSIGRIEIE